MISSASGKVMRGISQKTRCKHHHSSLLHIFPSNLLICFSYLAHLPALWAFLFLAKYLCFCLMHSLWLCPPLMYYKQAVSSVIHASTHTTRLSSHSASLLSIPFTSLLHFPKTCAPPFIFQSGKELMKHTATAADGQNGSCLTTHAHIKTGLFFSFLNKIKAH